MWKFSTWEICLFSICLFLQPSIYMDSYLLYFGLQSHTTLFSDSDGSSFDSFSVSSCSQPPCPLMHHHTLWTLQDAPDSSDVFPILDLWEFVSMEKKTCHKTCCQGFRKANFKTFSGNTLDPMALRDMWLRGDESFWKMKFCSHSDETSWEMGDSI